VKYRYPRISNTLTFKRINTDSVEVVDHLTDNRFEFSVDAVRYVRQLDGYTHPYKIQSRLSRKEIDDIVVFLDEHDLIRLGDTISISSGTKLKTLWIPRCSVLLNVLAFLDFHYLIQD